MTTTVSTLTQIYSLYIYIQYFFLLFLGSRFFLFKYLFFSLIYIEFFIPIQLLFYTYTIGYTTTFFFKFFIFYLGS